MRTIQFKNGSEFKIMQSIADILNEKIIEGYKQFQTFSDEKGVFLIVNVSEINLIY